MRERKPVELRKTIPVVAKISPLSYDLMEAVLNAENAERTLERRRRITRSEFISRAIDLMLMHNRIPVPTTAPSTSPSPSLSIN